jgi:Ca2+-binding EF-hand superfamily protein
MSHIPGLALILMLASAAAPAHAGEFELVDSNDDGRVSSSEFAVYARAVYDRMDSNADDKLTPAEIHADQAWLLRYVYTGGTLLGADAEPAAAEKLQRLDANQDGLIGQGEYADAAAAKFQKMDLNRNGELSFEEYWGGI